MIPGRGADHNDMTIDYDVRCDEVLIAKRMKYLGVAIRSIMKGQSRMRMSKRVCDKFGGHQTCLKLLLLNMDIIPR